MESSSVPMLVGRVQVRFRHTILMCRMKLLLIDNFSLILILVSFTLHAVCVLAFFRRAVARRMQFVCIANSDRHTGEQLRVHCRLRKSHQFRSVARILGLGKGLGPGSITKDKKLGCTSIQGKQGISSLRFQPAIRRLPASTVASNDV